MATLINAEKQTLTFVGNGQETIVIPFEKVETLAVEQIAEFGRKMGKIYYQTADGAKSWVAIASPESALPAKMASLAEMLNKATGKEFPISGV